MDANECWNTIRQTLNTAILPDIKALAEENQSPAHIVFGTSGWRGEIGTDFTFHNLRVVTAAIINILKRDDPQLKEAIGVGTFQEIRAKGVIVGHDNRFLGSELAGLVMDTFSAAGIKVYYGNETTTPEISASIVMLKAACAINITPSHNPFNYQGLKLNPSDGGPAGPEITNPVQAEAHRLMSAPVELPPPSGKVAYEKIDTTGLYIEYLKEKKTIDLERIREFVSNSDCTIAIDHVHGATRGRPARLFDIDPGDPDGKVTLLRTKDDYLFGGLAPEPSEKNMEGVKEILGKSSAKYRIGAIMDPDGDRIRLCDHRTQIPMNYFGAMALHFLHKYKGIEGIVVKSVGTSNLVDAIAKKHSIPVRETMVGFKNFRPYLLKDAPERAIVAFEESDGMTAFNHTLEKDALFGLLLAVEMVATTGKNLGDYLDELMTEYGYYYPDRSGIEVDHSIAGETLKQRLYTLKERYPVGKLVQVNDKQLKISDVITIDGIKIVFEDGSWLMVRPSGTEPKVRFYIEARTPGEREAIFATAKRLTEEAISAGS